MKRHKHYRLSEETIRKIAQLKEKSSVPTTATDIVELAVSELHKKKVKK